MALTQANDILNGYFYTFIYKAKDGSLEVDETPVIYCIGPAPGRDNNIIGWPSASSALFPLRSIFAASMSASAGTMKTKSARKRIIAS